MTEQAPAVAPPATVEVVALKVAEQLMADMYRRITELETRLAATEREADEAEREAEVAAVPGGAFAQLAQQLLDRADDLRTGAAAAGDVIHDDSAAEAQVVQLPMPSGPLRHRDG